MYYKDDLVIVLAASRDENWDDGDDDSVWQAKQNLIGKTARVVFSVSALDMEYGRKDPYIVEVEMPYEDSKWTCYFRLDEIELAFSRT